MSTWIDQFAGLSNLDATVRETLVSHSKQVHVPEGKRIFGPGNPADNLLLLLSGTVRVQHTSEGGREIVLYRVQAGQSCVLTTACLLAHEDYSAEGISETEVDAVIIPRAVFDDLVARSATFRTFVFSAYSKRITDLFRVIDDVAFGRIDTRLAQRLHDLSREGDVVQATHQQLANELGTAREVVSRQLTEFQRRGWISQSRGRIELLKPAALEALAEG